jgi:hypothetical protein
MYKQGGTGYVLISVKETHKNKTGIIGLGGQELVTDTTFSPEKNALSTAVVIQTPISKGNLPLAQIPVGTPAYGAIRVPEGAEDVSDDFYSSRGVYDYILVSDIQEEVEQGDQIFFKERILNNQNNFIEEVDGQKIFKVPYDCIYGILRKDGITMVGTWTLVEPIYEDWDDILIPTFTEFTDTNGDLIPRPKEQWIQTKLAPEHDELRGYVFKVGLPFKGNSCEIVEGMKVLFRPQGIVWVDVNDSKYMIVRQDNILAYYTD